MTQFKNYLVFIAFIYQTQAAAVTSTAYFEITDDLLKCGSGSLTLSISSADIVTKYKHEYVTAALPQEVNCIAFKELLVDGLAPGHELAYSVKQGALQHCIPHDVCDFRGFYETIEVNLGGMKFTHRKNVPTVERNISTHSEANVEYNEGYTGTQCGPANRKTGVRVCCT